MLLPNGDMNSPSYWTALTPGSYYYNPGMSKSVTGLPTPDYSGFSHIEYRNIQGEIFAILLSDIGVYYRSGIQSGMRNWVQIHTTPASESFSRNSSGFLKLHNRFIIQWGKTEAITNNSFKDVILPISFPGAVLSITANGLGLSSSSATTSIGIQVISNSKIRLFNWGVINLTEGALWMTIGY